MTNTYTSNQTVTFTITSGHMPTKAKKTLERLVGMQTEVQGARKALAKRRRLVTNNTYIRAGKRWTARAKATRLADTKEGSSFTLHVSPQILSDLKSVEKYLEAKVN